MVGSRGLCWSCGETLLPNEVAGVCPPCCWQWPSLADDGASCVLAKERTGLPVFGLGFRLRQPTESVVHRMKYGGFPKHGQTLGLWMGRRWRAPPVNTTLMPVPSHWRRVWRRGFNPSEALCDGLAKAWNRDMSSTTLRRIRHRSSLTEATRGERLDSLEGMFESVSRGHGRLRPRRGFGGRCADHRRHVPRLPKVPDSGRPQRAGRCVARLGLIPVEMPV